jgi:assimilatory nitrate reductase catalytic subunit
MAGEARTTCPYCGVGCGVLARAAAGTVEIRGDPGHPANFGRLCSKGAALADTLGLEGRLLHPRVRGQRVSWQRALTHVADELSRIMCSHGPQSVALYVSGQLLTEDYYVANKLMKGFIGTANIDTNSRLCMASAVAGHKRAFGADLVPGCYEDLELADLIVLVGSNAAWCHPVLLQRILQAKEARPQLQLVVIDPRHTPTCDAADVHIPVRAGTDVTLFNGLLSYLHRNGFANTGYLAAHTTGAEEALAAARDSAQLDVVARTCGVAPERIEELYRLFSRTERVVTLFSQGVNQSTAGTDKVNSIINCHLLTGRIGRPGMGPFSLTGQPNAMGGREVGGLANALAAHLELHDEGHRRLVQSFWGSPHIASKPGLKAVELFEAMHAGQIRAVWIMATNPLVSLPDANRVREALGRCELVVVSDCVDDTDTNALAQVLLPACAWGEKDGTVTNSERRISRQRAFLPVPGEARPDWWIVCEVAKRLGFGAAFEYASAAEIFDEHARLSATANNGTRCFDIGGLSGLTRAEYDGLQPVQWPVRRRSEGGVERLFQAGEFWNADGKARLVPTVPRPPAHAPTGEFPLILNTGRIRDQWHTMTRTGRAPRLLEHLSEPSVDLHAQEALLAGVRDGELVRVSTRWGSLVARLRCSGQTPRGSVFVPIHWSDRNASEARASALVNPAVDAISGEPEFKHTPARVEPFPVEWHAVVMSRAAFPQPPDATWWVITQGHDCVRYEFAGRASPADWSAWARTLFGATDHNADYFDYHDAAAGIYRAAYLTAERLQACLYVSRRVELPSRPWLTSLFAKSQLPPPDRMALLAGRPRSPAPDPGVLVCTCFGVGRSAIEQAIASRGLTTPREVSEHLRAGSNCGSCVPEIRALLAAGR